MAQFTLSVINNRGETVLTRYDAVTGETAGLTFDENFNLNVDGATLSFAMLKYYYEGSQKVVNTAATTLIYGSQIKLVTNGQQFMFNVQSINYQFMQENLQLNFSCIDAFQFETSKLGLGYTIAEDTTDPNYIGAQPIDSWANKIVRECGLRWQYVPIDRANDSLIRQFNSIDIIQSRDKYSSTDEEAWAERIEDYSVAPKSTNASLNVPVSFSCSNVNAYAALKELATRNELILKYDYATLNFWFVPQKNPYFKGYYFNPYNNLQAFSVAGNAQNLVTVLNVQGPKDYNDQEILLVPEFPDSVLHFIDTDEWKNSVYYSNLYIDNCATDSDEDDPFYTTSSYTPWLENKLINIDYFKDSGIITEWEYNNIQNILYNDLRIVNGPLITQTSAYLKKYEEDYMAINQKQIDLEQQNGALLADIESIYHTVENEVVPTPVPVYYPRQTDEGAQLTIGLYLPDLNIRTDKLMYSINNSAYANLAEADSDDEIMDYIVHNYDISAVAFTRTLEVGQLTISQTGNEATGYTIDVQPHDVAIARKDRIYVPGATISPGVEIEFSFLKRVVVHCSQREQGTAPMDATFVCIPGESGKQEERGYTLKPAGQLGHDTKYKLSYGTASFYYWIEEFEFDRPLALQHKQYTDHFALSVKWQNTSISGYERLPSGQGPWMAPYGALSLTFDPQSSEGHFDVSTVHAYIHGWRKSDILGYVTSILTSDYYTLLDIEPPTDYIYNSISIDAFYTISGKQLYSIIPPAEDDDVILKFLVETGNGQRSAPITITHDSSAHDGLYKAWSSGNSVNLQNQNPHSTTVKTTIAGLDERLTEIGASYQTNFNLYAEYMYKFQHYWVQALNKNDADSTHTIGLLYSQLRKVGVLSSGDDTIDVNSPYSESCPTLFTADDKRLFELYCYNGESQTALSRQEIITKCATIAATLTQYWSLAHSSAMLLGIFCPSTWDCLDILEKQPHSSVYKNQLPLLHPEYYTNNRWSQAPKINTLVIPEVVMEKLRPWSYKYYNSNREFIDPLLTLPTDLVGYSNIENYYQPWNVQTLTSATQYANYWGIINTQHRAVLDTDAGYMTKLKLMRPQYRIIDLSKITTLTQTIREWIAPAFLDGLEQAPISFDNIRYNPSISFIANVAQCAEYNDALYYELQKKRHDIWQHLYTTYPGVFRESNYVNQDAGTSQQLYNAAKAQLNMLSQPQFTYQLTGMDIYMHDSDYVPTRLTIGDQIHIDYQEDSHRQDTLYKALATPLYITSIRHSLRNDGDYQFEVSTTRGTDVMMQRFAQLLSFGK